MKKTEELKLIAGIFNPADARTILMDVFSSKIRFHQMNNFSSKERFGVEDKAAVRRIGELKASVERLTEIIMQAEKDNKALEINAQVVVNFKEQQIQPKGAEMQL